MKTAVITGASRGIGRATARLFARSEYNTVICYNDSREAAETLCAELIKDGFNAVIRKLDVKSSREAEELFSEICNTYGSIDVLVNNAGVCSFGLVTDVDDEEFMRVNSINYGGAFYCCREASKYMIKNQIVI